MPAPSFPIEPVVANDDPQLLSHNTHHIGNALARLLEQFKDKQRLKKVIEILLRPFQEAEDMLWSLYTDRRLDTAVGAQLDLLGKLVLEKRDGLNDTDYRAIIRIKIRVLRSSGSPKDLMQICDLMLQGTPYEYTELYPAGIEVALTDNPTWNPALLSKFLRLAKAGGIRLVVTLPASTASNTFRYGGLPETTNVVTGYGDGLYGSLVP